MSTDKLQPKEADVNPAGEESSPRRRYRSPRREEQARQTRMAILDAAQELFVEGGYVATTIADIAARANVAPETIYGAFRNKRTLLKRLGDVRAAGDEAPIPVAERDWFRRILEEDDGRRKLRRYAAVARAMNERGVGDLQLVIRAAASSDPQIAELWDDVKRQRLVAATRFASHLDERGLLRAGLSTERARDLIWIHIAPEIHGLLAERGWSDAQREGWLAETLISTLLEPAD